MQRAVHGVSVPAPEAASDDAPTSFGLWSRDDTAIVTVIAFATIFVHPVRFALNHAFWLDEAWVAVLTRAPLHSLPRLSSSAPIGFIGLLKLVPGSGLQRGRLVVLGFSALTAVAAYVVTRVLAWPRLSIARGAATVVALAVMLAPMSLVRNDLKQYTCDAFCALVLLALGVWCERTTTRSSLVWLAAVSVLTLPFSSTSLFVIVAVFAGLVVSALIDRKRERAIEIVVAGAATGVVLAVYFVAIVAPNLNSKLRAYWASFYLRGSPFHIMGSVWSRMWALNPYFAMPAPVFILLGAFGLAMLVRLRARAIAVAMPILWLEMLVMGRLQRYPFLDLRTSNFLLISSLVVAVLGAIGIVGFVRQLPIVTSAAASVVVALIFAVLFTVGFFGYVDRLHLPPEDVRSEVLAVAGLRHPGDVILVDQAANFGFSYYWPHGHVTFHRDDSGQGFGTEVSGLGAIYIDGRSFGDVLTGLRDAVDRLQHAGGATRLYIIRTHLSAGDVANWHRAFATLGVDPVQDRVGNDPLLVLAPQTPPPAG